MKKKTMISKATIKAFNPCQNRFDNFVAKYGDKEFTRGQFMGLKHITQEDKMWVAFRSIPEASIKLAAADIAESVLHIYETAYPGDMRPRKAIEAARTGNRDATSAAAASADAAASAANAAAAYAATAAASAANAATSAAAYAANAASYATAAAASAASAANAANAASYAAYYAANAAEDKKAQEKLIRKILIKYWK